MLKWNKSDRERHILYDLLCVLSKNKNNNKNKFIHQRTVWWFPELEEGRGSGRERGQKLKRKKYMLHCGATMKVVDIYKIAHWDIDWDLAESIDQCKKLTF